MKPDPLVYPCIFRRIPATREAAESLCLEIREAFSAFLTKEDLLASESMLHDSVSNGATPKGAIGRSVLCEITLNESEITLAIENGQRTEMTRQLKGKKRS
jgi:hypothetical protein